MIFPGETEVKLDANLVKSVNEDSYTLAGESSNDDRVLSIEGTVKDGVLNNKTTIKISSPIVGAWNLNIKEDSNNGNTLTAEIMLNVEGVEGFEFMGPMMQSPLVAPLAPDDLKDIVKWLADDIIAVSTAFDLGLGFSK